jgi:MarR family 2-MHQ and catechol resistance regulon transcriptional repressor
MINRYKGSKAETRALKTYVKLMRAAESATTRIHRHLASTGLTISQFAVLEALYHVGPLSQREIGKKILRSSGNITMVIDNLEKCGLVRRERLEADRRFYIIHLTDKGYHLIDKIFPLHASVIAKDLGVLTAAEQDALGRLCKKLGLREQAKN